MSQKYLTGLVIIIFAMISTSYANEMPRHCPWVDDEFSFPKESTNKIAEKTRKNSDTQKQDLCTSNIIRESVHDPQKRFLIYQYKPRNEQDVLVFGHRSKLNPETQKTQWVPEYVYYPGDLSIHTKQTYNELCNAFLGDGFRAFGNSLGVKPSYGSFDFIPKRKPLGFDSRGVAQYNDGVKAGYSLETQAPFYLYQWENYANFYENGGKAEEYSTYQKNHLLLKSFACAKPLHEKPRIDTAFTDPVTEEPSIDVSTVESPTNTTETETPSINEEPQYTNEEPTKINTLPVTLEDPKINPALPNKPTNEIQNLPEITTENIGDLETYDFNLPFEIDPDHDPLIVIDLSNSIRTSNCLGVPCIRYILSGLLHLVSGLQDQQQFNVVFFYENAQYNLFPTAVPANHANKKEVLDYINHLKEKNKVYNQLMDEYSKKYPQLSEQTNFEEHPGFEKFREQKLEEYAQEVKARRNILAESLLDEYLLKEENFYQEVKNKGFELEKNQALNSSYQDPVLQETLDNLKSEKQTMFENVNHRDKDFHEEYLDYRNKTQFHIIVPVDEDSDPLFQRFDSLIGYTSDNKPIKEEQLSVVLKRGNASPHIHNHIYLFSDLEFFSNDGEPSNIRGKGTIEEAKKAARYMNAIGHGITITSFGKGFRQSNLEELMQHSDLVNYDHHTPQKGLFIDFLLNQYR